MACVFIELGQDAHIDGDLTDAVNEGVRRGYEKAFLRKSITADPLQRVNTGDNTPAFLTVHLVPGGGCKITVAPKGAGSENMSRLAMLKPADGVEGVKKFVLDTVEQAGANPCPPIVLGIGIGGSFDHCAALAKKALLRPLDEPNADPYYAALEKELLDAINATGFGPQALAVPRPVWGLPLSKSPPMWPACRGRQHQLPRYPPRQPHAVRRRNDAICTENAPLQAGPCTAEGRGHRAVVGRGLHRP